MKRMHLTAVVISHKLEHFADRAIASVVTQTRKPDRLILLGTDCRQETKDVFNKWLQCPNAQACSVEAVYSKTPLTCTKSKNLAASLSGVTKKVTESRDLQQDAAFFTLDADDWIHPFYIQRLMPMMESGNYAGVGCDYYIHDRHGGLQDAASNQREIGDCLASNVMPSASIIKKSVFDAMGGYPEGFSWEDWAFWLTLYFNGYQFCRYPMKLYVHLRHETNKTNDDDVKANLAEIDRHIDELKSRHAERCSTMRDFEVSGDLEAPYSA